MPYITVEAEVDYDTSDFWWECSSKEKQELADLAIEEGLASPSRGKASTGISLATKLATTSYTEEELAKLLSDMWENRTFFDVKIVDELRENLRNKKLV